MEKSYNMNVKEDNEEPGRKNKSAIKLTKKVNLNEEVTYDRKLQK